MTSTRNILLVDDIPEYLDTMELNLPEGYRALRASSEQDAQNLIKKERPMVAVVDVRLSEDDVDNQEGMSLLKWIKTHYPQIQVIMISAYREFEFEAESLALGAEYFLRKPIRPDSFRKAVESLKERS